MFDAIIFVGILIAMILLVAFAEIDDEND